MMIFIISFFFISSLHFWRRLPKFFLFFFLVDFEQVFYEIFFVWKSLFHFAEVAHETFLQETMSPPPKNEGQQLFWK